MNFKDFYPTDGGVRAFDPETVYGPLGNPGPAVTPRFFDLGPVPDEEDEPADLPSALWPSAPRPDGPGGNPVPPFLPPDFRAPRRLFGFDIEDDVVEQAALERAAYPVYELLEAVDVKGER